MAGVCIGYVLYDLRRTIAVFTICAFLGFVVISIVSVALYFHSFTSYSYRTGTGKFDFRTISPATLILTFVIGVFIVNILGAIVGDYIAERTRRREKRLTLRCYSCGSWNEQDATSCSYCGKKLNKRTKRKTESKAELSSPSS